MTDRLPWRLRIAHWLRLVAPPGWILVALAAGWLLCEGLYVVTAVYFPDAVDPHRFFGPRDYIILLASLLCGACRVAQTHPAQDREYFGWLLRTPWQRGKPLPLGPVHLVPQDLLLVGLLMLLMLHGATISPASVPLAFLVAYLLQLSYLFWYTGQAWTTYGLAFWLGVVVKLSARSPAAALAAAGLAYLPAAIVLWRSLEKFPWRDEIAWALRFWSRQRDVMRMNMPLQQAGQTALTMPELNSVWPLNVLQHQRLPRVIERREAAAIALLLGWWAYVLWSLIPNRADAAPLALAIVLIAGIVTGGARLITYVSGHSSPITPWGRFWTMRWIIPRHDVVLLTPLAGVLAACGIPILGIALSVPLAAILGIGLATILLINLFGPPRLRRWQLTAPVRLSKPQLTKHPKTGVEEL